MSIVFATTEILLEVVVPKPGGKFPKKQACKDDSHEQI